MIRAICPSDAELLPIATGDGGAVEVVEHAAACPGCRYRLERITAAVRAVREGGKALDATSAPAGESSEPDGLATTADLTSGRPDRSGAPAPNDRPKRIGKYLVVERLGGGSQGDVYRVVHPHLGHDLALKLSRRALRDGAVSSELVGTEGPITVDFDHPGLLRVIDMDVYESCLYIVTEFVRGLDLEQYAKARQPDARACARLVAEVARAAEYVHRRGVVHQDIKPTNILVEPNGRTRLIDFGLAQWRHAWSRGEDGPYGGTPEFMPPEQAAGIAERIGPRSDVFALGAVLYFLLSGRAPFAGRTRRESWARACECDFDRAVLRTNGAPRRLSQIVLKAMAADPAARHASAEALAEDLERYLRRPKRVAVHAALLSVAAAVTVPVVLPNSTDTPRDNQRPTPPTPPTPAPKPALSGSIDVRLWHPGDPHRQRLALKEPGALPLRTGDQVRIEGEVNRAAYLYVIWIDSAGVAQPVYPWAPGRWERPAGPERPTRRVDLPEMAGVELEGWPVEGPRGMETLLLLARESPLPPVVDMGALLSDLPRPTLQDERALVWFDDCALVRSGVERVRGPKFFDPQRLEDPLLKTQALLKQRLTPHFSLMRAVSFANGGIEPKTNIYSATISRPENHETDHQR